MARIQQSPEDPSRRSERVQVARAIEKSKKEIEAKVTKPERFRRKQQRKSCHFLALPGELRKRIYKYTLLEHEEIAITSKGPGQPSLLRVCRGIRREATSIYYGENHFTLYVEDYKGADLAAFGRQSLRHCYKNLESNIPFGQSRPPKPNWDNLVAWLKAYDHGDMVVHDKNRPVRMPWQKKEVVLQAFYHGLKGTHSKWVKAEDL